MKILTLKKAVALFCFPLFTVTTAMAVDHGSMKGDNLSLYDQGALGGNIANPARTATLDFKIVTIGEKTWAWNKIIDSFVDTGADWCSQLRYWNPDNGKSENNMTNRNASNNQADEVWVKTSAKMPSQLRISFFQNLVTGGMSETEVMDYDPAAKNSIVAGDNIAPVISDCSVSEIGETTAVINITGNEDESGVFYYLAGNGIEEVIFSSTYKLAGLEPNTEYSFTVTPIDFSGNEGAAKNLSFSTTGLVHVTSGVAKDIKFVLMSSGTELEYYYELTDDTKTFDDAFLKITPSGVAEFEVKPTISPDGKYAYGFVNDARIANKVLGLNCGYLIHEEGGPVWEKYVMDNTQITEGILAGTDIKHMMGADIAGLEKETEVPVLTNVSLVDVTADHIILNLSGSDNSGTVYYEITGAKQLVKAYRTGTFYLTAIEQGKVYDLNIVAKDLSGNYSEAQQVKVKTVSARSNILDNENLNYNNIVKPGDRGGELTSIIKVNGNKLTIGCTTNDNRYTGQPFHPKEDEGFMPSVEINGVKYYLDRTAEEEGEAGITTATITFTDSIGEGENAIAIKEGVSFNVRWSVFWASGNGNFFTGTFTYSIGDDGQEDVTAPEEPVLSLEGNILTWASCRDMLSGVKYYRVEETTLTYAAPVIIFDLGEESFSYTLSHPKNKVVVTAVDFAGNESSAVINDTPTGMNENAETGTVISVYPNPAVEIVNVSGAEVVKAVLYNIQGQQILTVYNTNTVNVASVNAGLYILQVTDKAGNTQIVKLHVK